MMLSANSNGHDASQNFVIMNLRKYYPNPDVSLRAVGLSLKVSGILIYLI